MEALDLRAFYRGRRVLVTGHTGFKGAWLAWWLRELGCEVSGFGLPPEDVRGNLFAASALGTAIASRFGDVCDSAALEAALASSGAELVFHLAAQALVLKSYSDPLGTFRANALGTATLLEAVRKSPTVRSVVVVTTDKCYENREWPWPYRETDELGGRDPYSASKAMAELAASCYRRAFLAQRGVGVATARAGNVIGGGDYAPDRVIPDIVEAAAAGRPVVLRHPEAVRPWQHVLDALRGYLLLGARLHADPETFAGPFNFGPRETSRKSNVLDVTRRFVECFGRGSWRVDPAAAAFPEAEVLSLDPGKAERLLGWRPLLGTDEAVERTARWYREDLERPGRSADLVLEDIRFYMDRADHA